MLISGRGLQPARLSRDVKPGADADLGQPGMSLAAEPDLTEREFNVPHPRAGERALLKPQTGAMAAPRCALPGDDRAGDDQFASGGVDSETRPMKRVGAGLKPARSLRTSAGENQAGGNSGPLAPNSPPASAQSVRPTEPKGERVDSGAGGDSSTYPRDEAGRKAHPPTVACQQFTRKAYGQGEQAKGVEVLGGHLSDRLERSSHDDAGDPENQDAPGEGMEAPQHIDIAAWSGSRGNNHATTDAELADGRNSTPSHGRVGAIRAGAVNPPECRGGADADDERATKPDPPPNNCGSPHCPVCGDFWSQPCGSCGARRSECSC